MILREKENANVLFRLAEIQSIWQISRRPKKNSVLFIARAPEQALLFYMKQQNYNCRTSTLWIYGTWQEIETGSRPNK